MLQTVIALNREELELFNHDLGNLINTALIAFELLKLENGSVTGTTGAVLERSLLGLRALVIRESAVPAD